MCNRLLKYNWLFPIPLRDRWPISKNPCRSGIEQNVDGQQPGNRAINLTRKLKNEPLQEGKDKPFCYYLNMFLEIQESNANYAIVFNRCPLCFGILEEICQSTEDTYKLFSCLKVWELHMFQKEKRNICKVHPFYLVPVSVFVMECHESVLIN